MPRMLSSLSVSQIQLITILRRSGVPGRSMITTSR
ncbi:hypothetical protein LINGRAHAP2_LOCUS13898 [Linum grandiflorum]